MISPLPLLPVARRDLERRVCSLRELSKHPPQSAELIEVSRYIDLSCIFDMNLSRCVAYIKSLREREISRCAPSRFSRTRGIEKYHRRDVFRPNYLSRSADVVRRQTHSFLYVHVFSYLSRLRRARLFFPVVYRAYRALLLDVDACVCAYVCDHVDRARVFPLQLRTCQTVFQGRSARYSKLPC